MKYIDAEYITAVMINDRLLQGNAEFTLYAQEVDRQVNALPSIEIIRCKECKFKRIYEDETNFYYCALEDRPNRQWSVDETDYCSWAEREGE